MPKDDGGQAFPLTSRILGHEPGMSLRDYFAAQAMLGIVTGCNTNPVRASVLAKDADEHGCKISESIAAMAYELADAMLKQRASLQPQIAGEDHVDRS